MLISHRYGYLFVHLAKTGGTSIRSALKSGWWREPFAMRSWVTRQLSASTRHRLAALLPRHAPVLAAREMLAPDVFAGLFKFAFVRNPWDRMVSAYSHFQRDYPRQMERDGLTTFGAFATYLLETPAEEAERPTLVRALQRTQFESLVGFQGELLVDFVGRYEHLQADFSTILRNIPLPDRTLPHKRRSARQADYRSFYTDDLAERVEKHFAADIEAFQYTFDGEEIPRPRRMRVASGGSEWQDPGAVVPLRPRLWSEPN